MIELYHGYQKRYIELKLKIDELVPYLKVSYILFDWFNENSHPKTHKFHWSILGQCL